MKTPRGAALHYLPATVNTDGTLWNKGRSTSLFQEIPITRQQSPADFNHWFQNCWCTVDPVSVHIPALSTLQFKAWACHIGLWHLAQATRTNTSYWAKTLTALSIGPHLIRRLLGWLDIQSMWLGKLRKAFKKKNNKESLSKFVVLLHSFLLTVCIDQVRRSQFPANVLGSASWKQSKLNLPTVPLQFPHAVYYIKETSYSFMPGSTVSGKDATTSSNQLF